MQKARKEMRAPDKVAMINRLLHHKKQTSALRLCTSQRNSARLSIDRFEKRSRERPPRRGAELRGQNDVFGFAVLKRTF